MLVFVFPYGVYALFLQLAIRAPLKTATKRRSFFETLRILNGPALAIVWDMAVNLAAFEHITSRIIAAAIEVHRNTGPGMLELAYSPPMQYELRQRGLRFTSQQPISYNYKGLLLDTAYRADVIVEGLVVVELKSVATVLPIHEAQLVTYMRLADCPVGLIINFNVPRLVDGVKRKVNPQSTKTAPSAEAPQSGTSNPEIKIGNR